jgi:hypothetical protein
VLNKDITSLASLLMEMPMTTLLPELENTKLPLDTARDRIFSIKDFGM